MAAHTRVSRIQGAGITNIDGLIGWLQYDSAVNSGTIFMRSTSEADHLYISTNEAMYVSLVDMVDGTSDTFKLEKARGLDPDIETGKGLKVLNLVPGIEFETEWWTSTGATAVDHNTALDTDLGVDANGKLCVKQGSGASSTKRFRLIGNHVLARKTIQVRFEPYS